MTNEPMTNDQINPLILTLTLDPEVQLYFNALRKQHFPAERNYLDAHLTLFHQLPANEEIIITDINNIIKHYQVINLLAESLVGIGNGVAFKIHSEGLSVLHSRLQSQWQQWLIPQDRQKLWPHITIQNKALPAVAKTLIAQLSSDFEPFEFSGTGLGLWEYQGGPWKFIQGFDFQSRNPY